MLRIWFSTRWSIGAIIFLSMASLSTRGKVIDACVQLHGGAGYMDDYRISRLYTDARVMRIFAGTSEIMKEIIGRGSGAR
jgi:acyl-CoA dehydrogenase